MFLLFLRPLRSSLQVNTFTHPVACNLTTSRVVVTFLTTILPCQGGGAKLRQTARLHNPPLSQ